MKILLDTCTFLWIISDDSHLSSTARECFQDPGNTIYLSSVSIWEIMVKHTLGRLPLPEPPERFLPKIRTQHGIEPLPLEEEAVTYLTRLPEIHKDPFDRMLVCQALAHRLVMLTPDETLRRYPLTTKW